MKEGPTLVDPTMDTASWRAEARPHPTPPARRVAGEAAIAGEEPPSSPPSRAGSACGPGLGRPGLQLIRRPGRN
jgi:hypothetical protein